MQEKRQYPSKPDKVYFFGTCVVDLIYPDAGMAAIQLLEREGLEVIFPQDQSCCGQPAFNSGFPDEARQVAREQIRVFHRDLPIIVPSGSCAGMMRCHYPELFEGTELQAAAEKFAGRVFELTEFLTRVLKVKLEDRGTPMKVTWHSSCHALREMGVIDDSKSLLRQLKQRRTGRAAERKRVLRFWRHFFRQTSGNFRQHGAGQDRRHPGHRGTGGHFGGLRLPASHHRCRRETKTAGEGKTYCRIYMGENP